ncbi:MAG: four helix bundle protein [Nitrospirota bacterium]|nr:four helix bundle protein [Nitrospirota bacterium]
MGDGFKSLKAWQKAYELALEIYRTTQKFPKTELYGLTTQIQRAGISISANIAEGYERQYRKEYIQFLMIAKGSLGEVETYLMFAKDLGFITEDEFIKLEERRQEVSKLLRGLIKALMGQTESSRGQVVSSKESQKPLTLDP